MSRGNAKISTKKELRIALPQNCFWVHGGPILSDLQELHDGLKKEITHEQFTHHVNGERNDFADWVEGTLGDAACAKSLRAVKRKDTMLKRLEICLKGYKKHPGNK